MKKIAVLLVTICLFVSAMTCVAEEYTYFSWPNSYSSVGLLDVVCRGGFGDGETNQVFFVTTSGNSWMELKQSKGTCQELSYVKLFSGIMGTAKEWGKYEVQVHHAESNTYQVYMWDDTYYNESITLYMERAGHYYVYIRPFTNAEMTDSYLLDTFAGWVDPPQWWITDWYNCTYSSSSPFAY